LSIFAEDLGAGQDRIRIRFTSPENPALNDMPLNLSTQILPEWKQCA